MNRLATTKMDTFVSKHVKKHIMTVAITTTKNSRTIGFTIRKHEIPMQTILLCLKISFINIIKYSTFGNFCSVLFCFCYSDSLLNKCLSFTFVLLQKFLIRRCQRDLLSDNAKLSPNFLINFLA